MAVAILGILGVTCFIISSGFAAIKHKQAMAVSIAILSLSWIFYNVASGVAMQDSVGTGLLFLLCALVDAVFAGSRCAIYSDLPDSPKVIEASRKQAEYDEIIAELMNPRVDS